MARRVSPLNLPTGITAEIRQKLVDVARIEKFSDGGVIHQRGEKKPGLSIILSGAARIGNHATDGRYQLFALLGPGRVFGAQTLFADLPRTNDADAVGPTQIAQISRTEFQKLARIDRAVEAALMAELANRYQDILELLDDTRRLSVAARMAKLLANLSSQAADNNVAVVITQNDLADLLGVTRLSTHKNLKKIEDRGLIARQYGEIRILDRKALLAFIQSESKLTPL